MFLYDDPNGFLHLKNCNSWDYFTHLHQNFQCGYVSITLVCQYNRGYSKVSCRLSDIICVTLRLIAGDERRHMSKKPLDVIPLVNIGTIMVRKLSSITAFFTLKVKMKCMMVFYSLTYAMQHFYCK